MNPAELMGIFTTRLGAVQPPAQIDLFSADLMHANLDLMNAALKEACAIAARGSAPRNAREAVLALYNIKIAEVSQLFPLFFVFESAFRSFTAARLAIVYDDDQWWRPVRDAVTSGSSLRALHRLGGQAARRDVTDTVAHLIRGMGPAAARIATSYDLLEGGTLAHVERLINSHWSQIDHVLRHNPAAPKLTAAAFMDLFRVVRTARNDAYHHRSVAHRPRVVAIAERLLDMLDISLNARMTRIGAAAISPLSFALPIKARHA